MKRLLPYLFLTAIVLIIAVVNFKSGTFLTGWDNLHPELAPWLNLKRTLFTAWLEYRGVGLADGMAHAADLVRQLFLFLLYPVIPTEYIRFTWTMLTLWIGTVGMFVLISKVSSIKYTVLSKNEKDIPNTVYSIPYTFASTLGALFYLLNLATLQAYTVAFEVFTTQFAALPWLLLTAIVYLQNPTRKTTFWLVIVLLLSTPAAYVPTLFIVYLIAITIIVTTRICMKIFEIGNWKFEIRNSLKLYFLIFLINAFWLLPFAYFTITSSQINVHSKINQMATENIFQMNNEFGTLSDVMLLKGFELNSLEPTISGDYTYIMLPWKKHLGNPLIQAIGYTLFAVVLLGIGYTVSSIKYKVSRKNEKDIPNTVYSIPYTLIAFLLLFAFTITMLLTATPPFSWIDAFMRDHIPLFGQVFRFPFTKFSLLAALTYSVFFAVGIQTLFYCFARLRSLIVPLLSFNNRTIEQSSNFFFTFLFALLLIIFMFPLFQGKLFYSQEQLKIPHEYSQVFDFFQHQDPYTRIADLPQPTFWGWQYYNWGYRGSGFIWFGIPQPILHRAFDPWSNYSENYYFELSSAINRQDPSALLDVLQKYQVNWLLVDRNTINPTSPKALMLDETEQMIKKLPQIKKVKTFGKITIYKVNLLDNPKDFVFTTGELPTVNAYTWSTQDQAYTTLGNYISVQQSSNRTIEQSNIFPFHSLFSLKSQDERDFTQKETPNTITIAKEIYVPQDSTLSIPALDNWLAAEIRTIDTGKTTDISLLLKTPTVLLNNQPLFANTTEERLFTIPNTGTKSAILNVNGVSNFTIPHKTSIIDTTLLSPTQDNILTLVDDKGNRQTAIIPAAYIAKLPLFQPTTVTLPRGNHTLTVAIPKVTDPALSFAKNAATLAKKVISCEPYRNGGITTTVIREDGIPGIRMKSTNDTSCLSASKDNLSHRLGYSIFMTTRHTAGRAIRFWVDNVDQHTVPLETYLSAKNTVFTNTFVLPPQDTFGSTYAMHMQNASIATEPTENDLFTITMYPIPYDFLTNLVISSEQSNNRAIKQSDSAIQQVSHPNESLYLINLSANPSTLVLSQAYNPGWKAYEMNFKCQMSNFKCQIASWLPFLFGKEIKEHVMVNNWENGWILPAIEQSNTRTIVIVYLPQYLQYAGYILLIGTLLYTAWRFLRRPL